jgi:hypothetical protein
MARKAHLLQLLLRVAHRKSGQEIACPLDRMPLGFADAKPHTPNTFYFREIDICGLSRNRLNVRLREPFHHFPRLTMSTQPLQPPKRYPLLVRHRSPPRPFYCLAKESHVRLQTPPETGPTTSLRPVSAPSSPDEERLRRDWEVERIEQNTRQLRVRMTTT